MIDPGLVPLFSALIGGATGVAGTIATQRFTLRQDRERRKHESAEKDQERAALIAEAQAKAAAEAQVHQRTLALSLHRQSVEWLGAFHRDAVEDSQEKRLSPDLKNLSSSILTTAAEVRSIEANQLAKTAAEIYSHYALVATAGAGNYRSAYESDGSTEYLERSVHQLARDLAAAEN